MGKGSRSRVVRVTESGEMKRYKVTSGEMEELVEAETPRQAAMEAVRTTFASCMEEYILVDEKTPQIEAKQFFDTSEILLSLGYVNVTSERDAGKKRKKQKNKNNNENIYSTGSQRPV